MHTDLKLVADLVVPGGRDGIVVDGKLCNLPTDLTFEERRDRLADKLYRDLYIRPVRRAVKAAYLTDVNDFQTAIVGAIGTKFVWQPGWTAVSMAPNGGAMVSRNGLAFHAPIGEVDRDVVLAPGSNCTVRVPAIYLGALPGYLLVIGKNDVPAGTAMSRFYWHLKPETACAFAATATEALDTGDIPFRLKVVSNPDGYVRADSGVIYVDRRDLAAASVNGQQN